MLLSINCLFFFFTGSFKNFEVFLVEFITPKGQTHLFSLKAKRKPFEKILIGNFFPLQKMDFNKEKKKKIRREEFGTNIKTIEVVRFDSTRYLYSYPKLRTPISLMLLKYNFLIAKT